MYNVHMLYVNWQFIYVFICCFFLAQRILHTFIIKEQNIKKTEANVKIYIPNMLIPFKTVRIIM